MVLWQLGQVKEIAMSGPRFLVISYALVDHNSLFLRSIATTPDEANDPITVWACNARQFPSDDRLPDELLLYLALVVVLKTLLDILVGRFLVLKGCF